MMSAEYVGVFIIMIIMHTVQINDNENIQHEYVNIHHIVIVVRVAFCGEQNVQCQCAYHTYVLRSYIYVIFFYTTFSPTYRYRYAPKEYRILLVPFEVAPAEVRIGRTYIVYSARISMRPCGFATSLGEYESAASASCD